MKVSKIIGMVIFSCALLIGVCGCSAPTNSDKGFQVLEVGSFDGVDGGKHASEYSVWHPDQLNDHQDATAPKESTVVFNGVTYSGQYMRSHTVTPNTFTAHRYDGENVFFEINAATGKLSNILFVYEVPTKATLSEAECRKVADQIAAKFIDLDEYKVTARTSALYENFITSFTYCREVNGYKTSDSLVIAIDGNGNVSSFGVNMLGAFENPPRISLDEKQATQMIETKLNAIYAESTARKGYDIENVTLVKLPDGCDALLYTINNHFEQDVEQSGEPAQFEYNSQIQLLITDCDQR